MTQKEIQNYLEKTKSVSTLDGKVDFLYDIQKGQLVKQQANITYSIDLGSLVNLKNLFIIFPLIVIMCCIVYVIRNCYPRTVFLWGDCEIAYTNLASKRKTLWTVIIAALIIGILGNLFVFGLSGYVKIGS